MSRGMAIVPNNKTNSVAKRPEKLAEKGEQNFTGNEQRRKENDIQTYAGNGYNDKRTILALGSRGGFMLGCQYSGSNRNSVLQEKH